MIAALVILRQLVLQNQMATAAEPVKVERVIPAYAHPATRGFGAARINFRNN
jgi:hypothetical protein